MDFGEEFGNDSIESEGKELNFYNNSAIILSYLYNSVNDLNTDIYSTFDYDERSIIILLMF